MKYGLGNKFHFKKVIFSVIFTAGLLSWTFTKTALYGLTLNIKDVVKISSQRENYLIGYGLVVGLPQTGDSKNMLAKESLENILKNSGINSDSSLISSKNTAAVMVMASLKAASKSGDKLDVWISSIGDSKSLSGGFLLETPLMGQDGQTYAVAQANIPQSSHIRLGSSKGNSTVFVGAGATVEKNVSQPIYSENRKIRLSLNYFDIANLNAVMKVIEKKFPGSLSVSNEGAMELTVPDNMQPIEFLAAVMSQPVEVKVTGKVVVDPSTATIVTGGDVKINKVAVIKNGITIKVQGDTTGAMRKGSVGMIDDSTTVEDLVKGLNSLGLKAEDIIDILKSIHAAGALQGELIIL